MDLFAITIFIIAGFMFPTLIIKKAAPKHVAMLRILWLYHLFWGVFCYFFVNGDAIGYWKMAKAPTTKDLALDILSQKGTYFMYALNYIPANVLSLSYFSGTIIYCFIGYIGLVYFYIVTVKIIPHNFKLFSIPLFPALFFLPNLHFWSAAVGKDTLSFFCIGLFVYALLSVFRRLLLVAFSLLLIFFVRPHIALFLLISYSFAYLFNKKVSSFQRVIISVLLLGIGFALLPKVMEYAKIEETTIQDFNQFATEKASRLGGRSGSAVDISSYPLPLKVFTFLYRPLFFDINGIPGFIASLENLILLFLSHRVLKNKPVSTFMEAPFLIKGMVFFLIIGTLAFSNSLGNLGIMIRMRNMFLPGLLIYILWSFSLQISIKKRKMLKWKLARKLNAKLEIDINPTQLS